MLAQFSRTDASRFYSHGKKGNNVTASFDENGAAHY